jgi:hypothetical protein
MARLGGGGGGGGGRGDQESEIAGVCQRYDMCSMLYLSGDGTQAAACSHAVTLTQENAEIL